MGSVGSRERLEFQDHTDRPGGYLDGPGGYQGAPPAGFPSGDYPNDAQHHGFQDYPGGMGGGRGEDELPPQISANLSDMAR